jgi:hypothetical protein
VFTHEPPQLVRLPQLGWQLEVEQTSVPVHACPQLPQLSWLLVVSVSHPFVGLWSQSPQPMRQAPMAHAPPAHPGVAWGTVHGAQLAAPHP